MCCVLDFTVFKCVHSSVSEKKPAKRDEFVSEFQADAMNPSAMCYGYKNEKTKAFLLSAFFWHSETQILHYGVVWLHRCILFCFFTVPGGISNCCLKK